MYTCIGAALRFRNEVCGGEAAIREYCHGLARKGGDRVAAMLGTEVLNDSEGFLRQCCFANVRVPLSIVPDPDKAAVAQGAWIVDGVILVSEVPKVLAWWYETAANEYDTYLQTSFYNGAFYIRFSAQVYVEMADFEWGARTVLKLCERVKKGEWKKV